MNDRTLLRETIDLAHRAGHAQGRPYIEMLDLVAMMPSVVFDGMLSEEDRANAVAMNERFKFMLED